MNKLLIIIGLNDIVLGIIFAMFGVEIKPTALFVAGIILTILGMVFVNF